MIASAYNDPAAALMPPAAPLAMPVQPLGGGARGAKARLSDTGTGWRRAVLLAATLVMTAAGVLVMGRLLARNGDSAIDKPMLAIFAILFAWVAFSFVAAVAGFFVSLRRPVGGYAGPQPVIRTRTALLMPICNEDSGRVLAGVQAIQESLAKRGVAGLYDTFILSDTSQESLARAERAGVMRLRRAGTPGRLFYRRRADNVERKAGNIADWVRQHGGAYESMIILDADSLMTGDTLVRLTAAMERDPKVGLIQTLPLIINARTMFGRLQQFAGRIYGPMIAEGQNWWSGAEGNYWGHNAIIRTRAFAECAGLPTLAGGKPFAGHILSHDFVEAALLRRGGWAIGMAPELTGSFEETPPTLVATAQRDRRWCQGNLQHSALIGARGLHWVSRLHLLRGILSYATAPLWLAFLALGAVVWTQQKAAHDGPVEPLAIWLMVVTSAMLLGPKLLAALLVVRDRAHLRAVGGPARLGLGVLLEMVMSALIAPTMMLMQTRAVFEVLLGRDAGWGSQQRDDVARPGRQAWRIHRWHTVLGLLCAAGGFALDPAFFWWTSPVTIGLVLSAAVSGLSARPAWGDALRAAGLWLTPEETLVPTVVARAGALRGGQADESFRVRPQSQMTWDTLRQGAILAAE